MSEDETVKAPFNDIYVRASRKDWECAWPQWFWAALYRFSKSRGWNYVK